VNRAGVQAEELALCLTMLATEGAGQPVRAHVATFQDRTEDRPTFDAGGLQPSPERLNRHTIAPNGTATRRRCPLGRFYGAEW
jgi:hypothetical protein